MAAWWHALLRWVRGLGRPSGANAAAQHLLAEVEAIQRVLRRD